MALQKCWQKKGLRRRVYRNRYKNKFVQVREKKNSPLILVALNKIYIYILLIFSFLLNWLYFFSCLIYELFRLLPVWIYELFRFCPRAKNNESGDSFLIVGHRGAAAYEIENTISALDAAVNKYGANAVEIDLSLTKDRRVVLWHDWDPDSIVAIARQAGLEPDVKYRPFVPMQNEKRKPVHKLTIEELREYYGYTLKNGYPKKLETRIPDFEEFLTWASKQDQLRCVLLDIKTPSAQKALIPYLIKTINKLIDKYNPACSFIYLSPEEKICTLIKDADPNANTSFDMDLPFGIVLDPDAYSSVQKAIRLKNRVASAGRPTVLQLGPWTTYRRVVKHDIGLKKIHNSDTDIPVESYIAWTINQKREMRCLIKIGVDAILTDRPDRLLEQLEKIKS